MRDKGICARCGVEIQSKYNSGVSHYMNRRKESTRHDDDNCDLMCNMPCHSGWEHEKKIEGIGGATHDGEYTIWKRKQLGPRRFKLLLARANNVQKRDDEMSKLVIQAKIDILKEEE